jgi:hypothetical protein
VTPITTAYLFPEELLDGVGGDDEGVALREGLVGIDDHLQRADLGQQEEREQRKSRDDQQALAHDPGDERLQESPQGSNIDSSIVIMTISIVKSSDIYAGGPGRGIPSALGFSLSTCGLRRGSVPNPRRAF